MNKITFLFCFITFTIWHSLIGQSVAAYNIIFESFWNSSDHGTLPPSPHWSSLVGANHNSNITFFELGGIATEGIENIAETGNFLFFRDNEVATSIINGDTEQFINGGDLGSPTGTITINGLEVSEEFPLISLVSMIAPSPDWIISVNNINLRNSVNTDWQNIIEIDVFVYDAGTDSGSSYTSPDADVTPHIAINSLQGVLPFNNNRIGKLTITLQSVLSNEKTSSTKNIKIYPNPTKGKIAIFKNQNIKLSTLEIYTILGKLIKEIDLSNKLSSQEIDLTFLNKGVYLLVVKDFEGGSKTHKLVLN